MIMSGLVRIGRDAEIRFTQGGDAVASLSVVFNFGKKGQDGNKPSQWVDASIWGKRAEAMAPYLLKGTLVDVVLEDPHIETFEGKNGTGNKLTARVLAIEFAGGSKHGGDTGNNQPRAEGRNESADRGRKAAPSFDDIPDDLPF